jgi:hypothetical protein
MALADFMAANFTMAYADGSMWYGANAGNAIQLPGVGLMPSYARQSMDILSVGGNGHGILAQTRPPPGGAAPGDFRTITGDASSLLFYPQRSGNTVLYEKMDLTGANGTIWACNADGSNNRLLNYGRWPCLSGDGSWLVFAGWDATNGYQIWAGDVAGTWAGRYTSPVQVWVGGEHGTGHWYTDPNQLEAYYPAISIDGASLAYVRGKFSSVSGATDDPSTWGTRNVWRTHGDGVNNGSQLTSYGVCSASFWEYAHAPAFGPDNDTISWAHVSSIDGQSEVATDHFGNSQTFWNGVITATLNPQRIAGSPA